MLSGSGFAAYLCKAGGLQLNITIFLTFNWNSEATGAFEEEPSKKHG